VIAVTKGNPHSNGTVFESHDGVRFVVTDAKTWTEADAKLSAAPRSSAPFCCSIAYVPCSKPE
jgi:hypothetical protein